MSATLTIQLNDSDAELSEVLPVKVVADQSSFSICPQEYGDFASAEEHGCPVVLELHQGRLRLIVFSAINREDPTHVIDLEGARECRRVDQSHTTTPLKPLQEAGLYDRLLSKLNPRTQRPFTITEVAEAFGVESSRVTKVIRLLRPLKSPTPDN